MSFSMSRDEFAAYLDSVRITGEVATARENNLDHIQGFLDGNEHLEFGVQWTREWDYDSVFEVMVRRAGLNPDLRILTARTLLVPSSASARWRSTPASSVRRCVWVLVFCLRPVTRRVCSPSMR